MKRILVGALAVCLSLSLCGCSDMFGMFSPKPKDAAALMERVQSSMAEGNYALDADLSMEVSVESSGFSLALPIELSMDGTVNGDNCHYTTSVSASVFGQDMSQVVESYQTKDKVYTKEGEQWSVKENSENTEESNKLLSNFCATDFFAEAEMTSEDSSYTVTLPMEKIDQEQLLNLFEFNQLDEAGISAEEMSEALSKGTLTYVVDQVEKDYFLRSITMDEVACTINRTENGVDYSMDLSIGFAFNFSKYGEITEEEVSVPAEVVESAASVGNLPIAEEFLDDNTQEPNNEKSADSSSDAKFAVYGGQTLVPGSFTVDSLLDDFSYNEADLGEYSFLPMEYKANDNVQLNVFGSNPNSSKDILTQNIHGYKFSTIPDALNSPVLPDVSFGSITWGSAQDDVRREFGEPSSDYSSDGYWSLTYELGDVFADGSSYSLEFAGYDDTGVHSMALNYFNF